MIDITVAAWHNRAMNPAMDRRMFLRTMTAAGAGALAGASGLRSSYAEGADASLKRFLTRNLRDCHCPGLGLAAVYDGRVVWSDGLGLARVKSDQRVRRDTMFMLASVSKTV